MYSTTHLQDDVQWCSCAMVQWCNAGVQLCCNMPHLQNDVEDAVEQGVEATDQSAERHGLQAACRQQQSVATRQR
jgi:hypothetical protein